MIRNGLLALALAGLLVCLGLAARYPTSGWAMTVSGLLLLSLIVSALGAWGWRGNMRSAARGFAAAAALYLVIGDPQHNSELPTNKLSLWLKCQLAGPDPTIVPEGDDADYSGKVMLWDGSFSMPSYSYQEGWQWRPTNANQLHQRYDRICHAGWALLAGTLGGTASWTLARRFGDPRVAPASASTVRHTS